MSVFSKLRYFWNLAKDSVLAWMDDYVPSMGAALAFYTVFSVGPLLIIVIAVAGLVFGEAAAQGEVVAQLRELLGEEGAIAVQGLLKSASEPSQGIIAAVVSMGTLLLGVLSQSWVFRAKSKNWDHKFNDLQDSKFIKNKLCDRTR